MDSSDFPPRLAVAKPKAICDSESCSERPILTIESRSFCLEHLVSHFYSKLQEHEQEAFEPAAAGAIAIESSIAFLEDCRSKAAIVLITQTDLSNIDRARLLDILLWASELIEKHRRPGPLRKSAAGIQGKL